MRPRLMTSNQRKIAEFTRLGIDADIGEPAPDLREALAEPLFVSAQKAYACGTGSLCEDTRLDVEGAELGVLVKFGMEELESLKGRRARFACSLALATDTEALVWEGFIDGVIGDARGPAGFGFDQHFHPDGAGGLSLSELSQAGRKDDFSARARACALFKSSEPTKRFALVDLAAYEGPWQTE